MTWRAQLDGDPTDLTELAETFPSGGVVVSLIGDSYWLESDDLLDAAGKPDTTRARELLTRVNGSARILDPGYTPVVLTDRYENRENGDLVEPPMVALEVHMRGRGRMTVGGPPLGQPLLNAGSANSDVADLLRIAGRPARLMTWIDLYKVYEIVTTAMGGPDQVANAGWANKSELSRFRASANRPGLSGDEARHARMGGDDPTFEPMSSSEGQNFALRLAKQFIDSI